MSRGARLRTVRGILFSLLALGLVLAVPGALSWANRSRASAPRDRDVAAQVRIARYLETLQVKPVPRRADHAVFGADFRPAERPADRGRKLIDTAIGFVDIADMDAALTGVPAALREDLPGLRRMNGRTRFVDGGVNIVQIDEAALGSRGFEAISADLGRHVQILGPISENGLLVRGRGQDLEAVGRLPFVSAMAEYAAAFKVSPLTGRKPVLTRARAQADDLQLVVSTWQGADQGEALAFLRGVAGEKKVAAASLDGTVYAVSAPARLVGRLAQGKGIAAIEEATDYVLNNSEVPTALMIGDTETSFGMSRPYHELGIDGGGIDTNGDGRRLNNGTDAVPPQIVAVTDNGISYDAVHFSQTATAPSTITNPIGAAHRKVHSIQAVSDASGSTCDALLSGATTHGNVVAGLIAGNPGELGFTYTAYYDPDEEPPVSGVSLDALARGSRIIMQDAGTFAQCTINEITETGGNVSPGQLIDRLNLAICPRSGGTGACSGIIGGGEEVHLHVMPFGVPNFDLVVTNTENGTYPLAANQIDTFLVNNRDYMVFSPVGSQGAQFQSAGQSTTVFPDLFDGTALNDDPNTPLPLQMPPPATAKNTVTVGAMFTDVWTFWGALDNEDYMANFTSKGPATGPSLRTAPLVMAPGIDGAGFWGYPLLFAAATNRSKDNDNLAPVENEVDSANTGTSFSAAYVTAAGAIIRDYFAQGFYPTARKVDADRMPRLSGALVRAALVAGTNFATLGSGDLPSEASQLEITMANARAANLGTPVPGANIGVLGNNQQGYGRVVLDQVLPIENFPPTRPYQAGVGNPTDVVEYPAAGLIVYDMLGTGEPPIDNGGNTMTEKVFRVDGLNVVDYAHPAGVCDTIAGVCQSPSVAQGASCTVDSDCNRPPTRSIAAGQLRIALSWPDPPSAAGSGGQLVNDLDLEVQSPGADNIYGNADDQVYDGNVYISGRLAPAGEWGQFRRTVAAGGTPIHDRRNNIEAVHLSTVVDATTSNQIPTGEWHVRVMRGAGGALAGQISAINGPNEDANGNGRLDPGEDLDPDGAGPLVPNGLLDAGGQPFALVIAGPVLGSGSQTWGGLGHALPQSLARFDKFQYSCADEVRVTISAPNATAATVAAGTVVQVVDAAGAVLDEESGFVFTETITGSHSFTTAAIPSRLVQSAAVRGNGILEGDNGQSLRLTFNESPRPAVARARFQCSPNIIQTFIDVTGQPNPPSYIGGGCDADQYLDAGERVTYSIGLRNYETADDLNDFTATLTPSGPGAGAIRVLDSPKNIGRVPGGQENGVTFVLSVDAAAANALSLANRKVDLVLTLDKAARGVRLSRSSFTFSHVINADKEALHYSTDFPAGGRQVRDFNRNLQIDRPDTLDPFKGVFWPDEDITFSSLFVPGTASGWVTNTLGEDLNNNKTLDAGEDVIPNNKLDYGILASPTGPTTGPDGDKVPWNFDASPSPGLPGARTGGWVPLRHPRSAPGLATTASVWEHRTSGLCGFQTATPDGDTANLFQNNGAGIWHTGDGNPNTPTTSSSACDEYAYPSDPSTPAFTELIFDILTSPIVAKVHQTPDARGFPYSVEFQRLGLNLNIQTADYAGGEIDFDNDIDNDQRNALVQKSAYFYYRFPDIYSLATLNSYTYGINPISTVNQHTFGKLTDPNGSFATRKIDGDETGFTGFNQNTNASSTNPFEEAEPDYLPYPVPGAPQVCAPGCTNPAECCEQNTVAGPERNLDFVLLEFNDGRIYNSLGPGQKEPQGNYNPGPAGNRWQIGVGFWVLESTVNDTDYGIAIDDPVLEWDEVHPVDEGGNPACSRFGGAGQPAGGQCATLSVDRFNLYECNESVEVTVNDPLKAGQPSVTVYGVSDSDSTTFSTGVVLAKHPNKSFQLPAVPGETGLFRGNITVSSLVNNPASLFVRSGDSNMTFYYLDSQCDGDRDGTAGENDFGNLDNDNIPAASDNCSFLYNPGQEDLDLDGVGNLCDNCPGIANATQLDSDADRIGDACDLDDIDFDGVVNTLDNCPDVYNPLQIPGQGSATRGEACNQSSDRDGDGVQDRSDLCVRTANPAPQIDRDGDGVGDFCDGDCANPRSELLATGVCSRSNTTICTADAQCPTTGFCSVTTTKVCASDANCGPQDGTCQVIGPETCQRLGVVNDGSCGAINDDFDADGVEDAIDNCPTISNPPIVPGTKRQLDTDQDGRGDACDPTQTVDDDNNGIPDDVVSFNSVVSCKKLPLASIVVLGNSVRDLNGDGDVFADPGEIARMSIRIRNGSPFPLSGLTLVLTTTDPDISCVTKSSITVPGALAAGAEYDTLVGLGQGAGEFEFIVSPATETVNPANPAKGSFILTVVSNEVVGTAATVAIDALLDLDTPAGGVPDKVPGPDGVPGTADDGLIFENFDSDRDGDGVITLSNLPRGTPGVANDTIGVWVGTQPGGINVLSAIGCAGFQVPPQDPACIIDPDNDMDWHIHCPTGTCPNGAGLVTPTGGAMAYDGFSSLHFGHHFDVTSTDGDSTKFRQLAAFMTNPVNLTVLPEAGDLELSFFHIAAMMDNNNVDLKPGQACDFGDVQIQVDENPVAGPENDSWGFWDKLAPFENVYDHISYIWSTWGTSPTYCTLTPTDTGSAPYAPRGVHETLCFPLGVWSSCGNPRDQTTTYGCSGGESGSQGNGLWVQSKFNLAGFLGQRVRIRWIGQVWEFDATASSYYELGGTWAPAGGQPGAEGWWIDQIKITGALVSQATPVADLDPPANGACPTQLCDSSAGDGGFNMSLQVLDAGNDGLIIAGEPITLSATGTTQAGDCIGGITEYRFTRNGAVVQDWSAEATFHDNPTADVTYSVKARCSVEMACTSAGTSRSLQVFTGDGADIGLILTHVRSTGTTSVSWAVRPQTSSVGGYSLYKGPISSSGDASLGTLGSIACMGNFAQGAPGATITGTDTTTPTVGTAVYFLAGHKPKSATIQPALGRRGDGSLRPLGPICP